MKKRLICLGVSLLMAVQLLGGWPAAAADAGRVAAENSFATDLFCVETVAEDGKTYRLEHWDPNGANGLCLWTNPVTAAAPSNGGWKLKPAADGHYYLVGNATVLTAASETAVVVDSLVSGNAAQQWDIEPVEGGDGFDCKIVNVQYQAELTYTAPAADKALIRLAADGETGAVWAIENISKGNHAFLIPGPSPEDGDRTAASNNFAADVFTLETADGAYQVEHYKESGSPSLWGAYSTTANLSNGGWKLTPVKGGYYRITASTGTALAAASETEVVWNQEVDAASAAQQWKLEPDESTPTPYDCKLVNAQYKTQLTYAKPAANDADLSLTPSGDSWVVRNLKQTELLGFVALVMPGDSEYVDWGELASITVNDKGEVTPDNGYDGPQVKMVRVINEGTFLEIYWDRYVDEIQAVNVDNFVLKNGDDVIELEAKGSDYTNTLYFDKGNKEIAATDAKCMSRLADDMHMSSICYKGTIDASKGLTLEVKGAAIKDEAGNAAKQAAYRNVPKVDYYTQFLTSRTGIIMKADDTVHPDTLKAAAAQVDAELAKTETGIAANMAEHGCSLAIYSPQQNAYFIPEHRYNFRNSMYDVEGYGGNFSNNCVSSIAERNVLRTKGNADTVLNTAYPDENILIHEFGHCIKSVGIESLEDQALANELFAAYENAKDSGLWPNTYRISNSDEYFATMCAVWFNVMDEVDNWNDGTRCPLNTREELKKYDPVSYAFFEKILPSDVTLPAPWDKASPDVYHDEYVDPAPLANQVEAAGSDLENDLFMLEASYRGERKLIERYDPEDENGSQVCLWWKYSKPDANSPENTDPTQLWTYKAVKTAEGYYRFVTPDGSMSITATGASTVGVMGHAPDAADTAQQWKFVEDAGTASLYDGRLVSVKYGTELAFGRPFEDGSIIALASAGSGDRWFIRNVTQSAAVGKEAYLKPVQSETAVPGSEAAGFADTANRWCAEAVAFVTSRNLFSGVSKTSFSPDTPMTRGMLMTVLARYDGQDTAGGSVWYEKGMAWAKSEGVSDGANPEQAISRQELAAMLYRYAGQPAASGSLAAFPDSADAAQWAEQALVWAVSNRIITGNDTGTLDPRGSATRAQVAVVLMRFITLAEE